MASKEKIRMRINKHDTVNCETCGDGSSQVLEMFDLMIGNTVHTICDRCVNKLFSKTLTAVCGVDHKIKSQHDLAIIRKRNLSTSKLIESSTKHTSINEALSGVKDTGDE